MVEPAPNGERRRARVLVIDDEPAISRLIQQTLGARHDITVTMDAGLPLRAATSRGT